MIQTKGGAPKPDLDIDWRGRSEAMHGRAQQAEGALLKMMRRFMIMQAVYESACRRAATQKKARQYQRQRADRWQAEAERLRRERDPLFRIIAVGREFP